MEEQLVAGLDLGKMSDPTAFALFKRTRPAVASSGPVLLDGGPMGMQTITPVVQLPPVSTGPRRWSYQLIALTRFELGTKYTEICEWLKKAYSKPPTEGGLKGTLLAVDKTGVGSAVVEMVAESLKKTVKLVPITITGGGKASEDLADGNFGWKVPKKELVSILQALMGTGRMHIDPRIDLASVIVKEFENFKVKINEATANESYEAWRDSDHDDCVLACAMILWLCERGQKEFWLV